MTFVHTHLPTDFDALVGNRDSYFQMVENEASQSIAEEKALPETVKSVQRETLLRWLPSTSQKR